MALADIDVAIGRKGSRDGLPQIVIAFGFVPIAAMALHAEGLQQLSLRADLHHRRAVDVTQPDIIVAIHRHAMGLVLMADHILANSQNQFVVGIELEQLGMARRLALVDPDISFGIDTDRRWPAIARRQMDGIGE